VFEGHAFIVEAGVSLGGKVEQQYTHPSLNEELGVNNVFLIMDVAAVAARHSYSAPPF
jgi:DNA topoisomerase VI subunit B